MKKYGIIGYPLGHSFSKSYFSEKFEKEGIKDVMYENYPIENISEFEGLFLNDSELFGLNVTIPYKEKIVEHLDALTEDAREVGAVNTVCLCRKTGKLARVGHNTDVLGFRKSLEEQLKTVPGNALVLGTGGSSKAVRYVLHKMGIPFDLVSSSGKEGALSYDELDASLIAGSSLIINTTPLGMHPNTDEFPALPYKSLSAEHLLFDLVYNPAETLFMKKGREQDAKVVNGYDMLVYQAEGSWEIWNRK